MTPENINKLPLAVLRDIHALLEVFEDLYKKNSDIILRIDDKHEDVLRFTSSYNSGYVFIITNPRLDARLVNYTCKLLPSSELSFEMQTSHGDAKNLPNVFQIWINIMKDLDKYRTLLSEPFLNEYTNEFFAEFEFIEEDDDDTVPYETQKQIALYNALEQLEASLRNQEDTQVIADIIKDTVELKENIQNISKGAAKKRVAKIFAKIKKGGIKLLKDIIEVGYKEIIKAALHSGTDGITHLLN